MNPNYLFLSLGIVIAGAFIGLSLNWAIIGGAGRLGCLMSYMTSENCVIYLEEVTKGMN